MFRVQGLLKVFFRRSLLHRGWKMLIGYLIALSAPYVLPSAQAANLRVFLPLFGSWDYPLPGHDTTVNEGTGSVSILIKAPSCLPQKERGFCGLLNSTLITVMKIQALHRSIRHPRT